MAKRYTSYPLQDVGRGIDTYRTKDNLPEGMLSDVINMDPESNGTLGTRKGYQRYYGCVPLRVNTITHDLTNIILEFDSSQTISLATAGDGPILVAGKLPDGSYSGDFGTTFASRWYDSYELTFRERFTEGNDQTITKTASQTGISSTNVFAGFASADSVNDSSNTLLWPELVTVSKADNEITITYDAAADFNGYFYFLETPTSASGTVYVHTFTSSASETITAATHGLSTSNFIVKAYADETTQFSEVYPANMTIDNNGDLTVEFDTAVTGKIIMYSADPSNIKTFAASPGDNSLQITGVTSPFNFVSIWAQSGTDKLFVTPGAISWDESTSTMTIDYALGNASAETVDVYWAEADFNANTLTIPDSGSVSESYTVTNPQLTVWGICHSGIYKSAATKGGHINHIDNYKSELEERIICGLGGNVFQALSYEEGAVTYKIPSYTARGQNTANGDSNLAPLFAVTGSSLMRTRGLVTDDSIVNGYAKVTAVDYVSSGVANFTLTFDNKSDTIVMGTHISTSDKLTVTNTSKSVNSSSFKISSIVSQSATTLVLQVEHSGALGTYINEANINALGNVFTDKIAVTATSVFIPDDTISSVAFDETKTVVASSGTDVYVSGVTAQIFVPDGVTLFLSRTSDVIPLKLTNTEIVTNIVRGDSIRVTGLQRRLRVTEVNSNATASVTITVSSGTASVTMTDHNMNVGGKFFLYNATDSDLVGSFTITNTPDVNTFEFATDAADGSYTAVFQGMSIQVDESISFDTGPTDTDITVDGRWVPLENPSSTATRVSDTKERHFDENSYSDQPYLRSVIVNDNMYFTNGFDEVKKFDGTSVYNAGIPAWQPWAFLSVDTGTTALPSGQRVAFTNAKVDASDKYFTIAVPFFNVGDRFKESVTNQILTVSSIELVPGTPDEYRIYVAEDFTAPGSDGDLIKANIWRYYAKINMIDANNNIISGATLGADDLFIETFDSAAIDIKLMGLPAYEELDYDRLEISLYRAKRNQPAPFYLVRRASIDYSNLGGYVLFKDTVPDNALTFADLDPTISVLTGGELGNQWNLPPKAKVVTTAGNRLILGNIKSPATLDVTFRKISSAGSLAASDFASGQVLLQKTDTVSADANNSLVFSFENTVAAKNQLTPASHITIASNSITIDNGTAPGVTADDWVYLFHSAAGENNLLDFAGWYRVDSTSGTAFTIRIGHSRSAGAASANDVDRWIASSSSSLTLPLRVPVWIGTDGNYNQRNANSLPTETIVATRLGVAINAVMATEDPGTHYWATTVATRPAPWLRGLSGQSFQNGRCLIYLADAPSGSLDITPSAIGSNVQTFVNNTLLANGSTDSTDIRLFNSRLVLSYANFPEIFDASFEQSDSSPNVIDVNPADGQEMTMAVPFFGQSAFGAAQLAQAVVVFKTNSVYLVDINTGQEQKLQTYGQGCTAPRSVTVTQDGIIFANRSGVYRLTWQMQVQWLGMPLDGAWKSNVQLSSIDEFAGHNYSQGRKYKLSYATSGNSFNDQVFVYDFTREQLGQPGAWTVYDNHDATGWTNQAENAYWGSQDGLVHVVRNNGDATDYRDDASAITQSATFGAMHFGLPNERKTVNSITVQFQTPNGTYTGVTVSAEQSLSGTFNTCGTVDVPVNTPPINFSLPERKGTYISTKITAGTIDQKLQLSKIIYEVSPISSSGVPQSANFNS